MIQFNKLGENSHIRLDRKNFSIMIKHHQSFQEVFWIILYFILNITNSINFWKNQISHTIFMQAYYF